MLLNECQGSRTWSDITTIVSTSRTHHQIFNQEPGELWCDLTPIEMFCSARDCANGRVDCVCSMVVAWHLKFNIGESGNNLGIQGLPSVDHIWNTTFCFVLSQLLFTIVLFGLLCRGSQ